MKDDDVFSEGKVLMEKVRPLIQSLVKKYHTDFLPQFNEQLTAMQSKQQQELIASLEVILGNATSPA